MNKYIVSLGDEFLNVNLGFTRLYENAPTYFESEREALQAVEKFASNFMDFIDIEAVGLKL